MKRIIKEGNSPVWVNAGVLTDTEIADLRKTGINLTNFSYYIDPTKIHDIGGAISTIQEHHPGERIWVEVQTGT